MTAMRPRLPGTMAHRTGRLRPRIAAALGTSALLALIVLAAGCGRGRTASAAPGAASPVADLLASSHPDAAGAKTYTVSAQGGTPATGPGGRFNHCERIWCMVHRENFAIDHFMRGHLGWILHDEAMGDVFVQHERDGGPTFPNAKLTVLRLCGAHVHPHILGKRGGPVRDGMYSYGLEYNRSHFRQFGTRLEPCCINGIGWDFVHAGGPFFRFHDVDEYRTHPERGWQKPFPGGPPAS